MAKLLKTNTTLTRLDLWDNKIGDAGAQALAETLKTNTTLTRLDLGGNKIGDAGAQALAEFLKTNTTLTTLYLGYNAIGATGEAAKREIDKYLERNRKLQAAKKLASPPSDQKQQTDELSSQFDEKQPSIKIAPLLVKSPSTPPQDAPSSDIPQTVEQKSFEPPERKQTPLFHAPYTQFFPPPTTGKDKPAASPVREAKINVDQPTPSTMLSNELPLPAYVPVSVAHDEKDQALLQTAYNVLDKAHPPQQGENSALRRVYLLQLAEYRALTRLNPIQRQELQQFVNNLQGRGEHPKPMGLPSAGEKQIRPVSFGN